MFHAEEIVLKLNAVNVKLPCFRQVFFVESVCDDPEVIAANILVGTYVINETEGPTATSRLGQIHNLFILTLSAALCKNNCARSPIVQMC